LLPLGEWFNQLQQVRNRYAAAHQLPETALNFDWQDDTSTSLGASTRHGARCRFKPNSDVFCPAEI
jgi:hypothetical protein